MAVFHNYMWLTSTVHIKLQLNIAPIVEYIIASWLPYQLPASEVLLNNLERYRMCQKIK